MASNINVVGICARKGDIPTGTGQRDNGFCRANPMPLDASGNALPGYTLQSNKDSLNGTSWAYTGAEGKTTRLYDFPNCPIPFPTPAEVNSDIVQITRVEPVVPEAGLIDISMPIFGIQGQLPTHTLPSLCDVLNQVVFFFDDANAAVNVYQIQTKEWRMGWVRGVPGFGVRWRAAALLTEDKIKTSSPTYVAPYNSKGIFLSIGSNQLTNQNQQTKTFGQNATGFYFINYTVTSGSIQVWTLAAASEPYVTGSGDLSVSAIETVNQNVVGFYNPTAGEAKDVVAAVATSQQSTVGNSLYGWWGFLAKLKESPFTPRFFNPNLSTSDYLNFCFRSGANPDYVPTGFMETISYDGGVIFFLGGNFSHIRFDNTVVEYPTQPTVVGAVAIQYNFTSTAMTVANYTFVGPSPTFNDTNWSGRIAQSNYREGYFAYGGTFKTPESLIAFQRQTEFDAVLAFIDPVPFDISGALTTPVYKTGNIPSIVRGGNVTIGKFVFDDTSPTLVVANPTVDSLGVCLNIVPDNGDVTQGSFAPRFIGGNFLNPESYSIPATTHYFQTQQYIKPSDWWISTVNFYVQNAPATQVTFNIYLTPDPLTLANAPYFFDWTGTLRNGLNTIPFVGGEAFANQLYNTHVKRMTSSADIGAPQSYFLVITNASTSFNVGLNTGNGNSYAGCWYLEGYPVDTAAGRFSATAIDNNDATYIPIGNRVILTYKNLAYPSPLSVTNYSVYVVPINMAVGNRLIAGVLENTQFGLCQFTLEEDRQGTFEYSCLHKATIPSVLYDIPTMNTTTTIQPAFSLFMNSRYEIYKTAFANGDDLGLGLYTNFQEVTDVFSIRKSTIAVNLEPNQCNITTTASPSLAINVDNGSGVPVAWPAFVKEKDIVKIQNALTEAFNEYQINTINVVNTAGPVFEYALTKLTGALSNPFGSAGTPIKITFVLSRNPLQTPFVLKTDLGQYKLGNGSAPTTLRDIYLSPSQPTGKAYRYVPDYENNFLSFQSSLFLNSPTVDDLYDFNTAMFNSNGSSVLLTARGNDWLISRVSGNVGFNTQNV